MPRLDLAAHRAHLHDHGDVVLQQALTGDPDGRLPGFRCAVDAVHFRPGRDVSIGYEAWYDGPDGPEEIYLVATTADVAGQVAQVENTDYRFRVWTHPYDPVLVSAPQAFDSDTVAQWLATAGVSSGPVGLTSLAYRPMRRAVLRATTADGAWFVKLQRRRRHLEYLERMVLLAPHGVTPPVVAVPAKGVTITAAAPGTSLAVALAAWSMTDVVEPSLDSVLELLDAIPSGAMTLPHPGDWRDDLRGHAHAAAVELPGRSTEIEALANQLLAADATADLGPLIPTHGDFYEANIFTVDGRATSFIDIESVGPGHLVDELACLLGHLVVLPDLSAAHYARLPALIPLWWRRCADLVDAETLRVRTTARILSLISGAGPEQAGRRLNRALELFADEGALT